MAAPIGPNHGAEIHRTMLHDVHPDPATMPNFAIDSVWGEAGKAYDPQQPGKKATGTIRKLAQGHDEVWSAGGLAETVASLKQEVENLRDRPFG